MKFELFVDQPSLDLMKGIKVKKDTEISFKNENVEQLLKDLKYLKVRQSGLLYSQAGQTLRQTSPSPGGLTQGTLLPTGHRPVWVGRGALPQQSFHGSGRFCLVGKSPPGF